MWKTFCYTNGEYNELNKDVCVSMSSEEVNVISLSSASNDIQHQGAKVITEVASNYFIDNFDKLFSLEEDDKIVTLVKNQMLLKLIEKAKELEVGLKDITSNLSLIAIKNEAFISFQVGSGAIVCLLNQRCNVIQNEGVELINNNVVCNAMEHLTYINKGVIESVTGIALLSSGMIESCYLKKDNAVTNTIYDLIISTSLISNNNLSATANTLFEQSINNKTLLNCSLAIIAHEGYARRFYSMSDTEKVSFFKFSHLDPDSINRVKSLEGILYNLDSPQTLSSLSKILKVKEIYLQRKLDFLILNNLIQCEKGFYKKIN